jgi:hypothetical protein
VRRSSAVPDPVHPERSRFCSAWRTARLTFRGRANPLAKGPSPDIAADRLRAFNGLVCPLPPSAHQAGPMPASPTDRLGPARIRRGRRDRANNRCACLTWSRNLFNSDN